MAMTGGDPISNASTAQKKPLHLLPLHTIIIDLTVYHSLLCPHRAKRKENTVIKESIDTIIMQVVFLMKLLLYSIGQVRLAM